MLRVIDNRSIEHASVTDVGIRRSHNQDAHVIVPAADDEQWQQRGHVLLVADGMGAHAVGELASKLAVDNIPHIYTKHAQEGPVPALRKAFVEGNAIIHTRGKQNREFEGMGTTGTALVIRPEGVWVGHVGDSRAYRIRNGVIEQLSFDHSLLWELARRQGKNPEELVGIPSNVIVRSLGPEALVQVDVEGPHPLEPGDVYLLCSDGLSGQVTDREIGAVAATLPPSEAARFLVHLANLHGGPDNTTVLIARLPGETPESLGDSTTDVVFPSGQMPNPTIIWKTRAVRLGRALRQVPWSVVMLLFGIALAGLAIYLSVNEQPGGFTTFILAGLLLLGGVVSLMIQNLLDARVEVSENEPRPLQIYRQAACAIDRGLVDRVVHAAKTLEEDIRVKNWPIDNDAYQHHLEAARTAFAQQRLREAFREQCRALLVLMETVHQHRGRGEEFSPRWERAAQPRSEANGK
jgi:serine/threonine protein phosphatase PrpC